MNGYGVFAILMEFFAILISQKTQSCHSTDFQKINSFSFKSYTQFQYKT